MPKNPGIYSLIIMSLFLNGCASNNQAYFPSEQSFCALDPAYPKEAQAIQSVQKRYRPPYQLLKIVVPCQELQAYRENKLKRFGVYKGYFQLLPNHPLPIENLQLNLNDVLP